MKKILVVGLEVNTTVELEDQLNEYVKRGCAIISISFQEKQVLVVMSEEQ